MDFRLGSARNLLFQTILKYVQKHIVTDIYVGEMEFSSFILKIEVDTFKKEILVDREEGSSQFCIS